MKKLFSLSSSSEDVDNQPSQEELDMYKALEELQETCPNKHNHEAIKNSGSDDGCLECGFYSK